MKKICNKCKLEKDIKFFSKDNSTKDKLQYACAVKQRKYFKTRRENDKVFLLRRNVSNLIRNYFKNKNHIKKSKTQEILGCSFEEFKFYLESKFKSWMNWQNYGKYNGTLNYGWDMDHIIPISSAKTEKDVIQLNHFTNFQPLCSKINRDVKKDNK